MRFVGIDLAWSTRANTGVCLVEGQRVVDSALLQSDDEIVAWVEPHAAGPCLVAIDAPLVVRNATGRRPCERVLSRCFGAYHAGPHSSNLGLAAFRDGVRAERLASRLGLATDPSFPVGEPFRRAIEVYPHPALVALFGLQRTLKDKAKRGRSVAQRRAEFATLIAHLEGLRRHDPPLAVTGSPRWEVLREAVGGDRGSDLDRAEDELDAYVCAYVALHYRHHGTSRSRVVGDVATGYVVTPVTAAQGECIDRAWAALMDP